MRMFRAVWFAALSLPTFACGAPPITATTTESARDVQAILSAGLHKAGSPLADLVDRPAAQILAVPSYLEQHELYQITYLGTHHPVRFYASVNTTTKAVAVLTGHADVLATIANGDSGRLQTSDDALGWFQVWNKSTRRTRGRHNQILESAVQLPFKPGVDLAQKEKVRPMVVPLQAATDGKGTFSVSGTLIDGNELFRFEAKVSDKGNVALTRSRLATGLPLVVIR